MKTVGFSHVGAGTLLLYSMVVAICTIAGPRVSYAADAERALRHQSNGNAPSATTGLAVQPTGSVEPSVSCLANPSQIAEGGTVEIVTEASSPERLPLTYSWSASAGTIYGGDEDKATLFTTDVAPGTITVTCRVADDQGELRPPQRWSPSVHLDQQRRQPSVARLLPRPWRWAAV